MSGVLKTGLKSTSLFLVQLALNAFSLSPKSTMLEQINKSNCSVFFLSPLLSYLPFSTFFFLPFFLALFHGLYETNVDGGNDLTFR